MQNAARGRCRAPNDGTSQRQQEKMVHEDNLDSTLLILRTEVGNFSHHRPEGYMSGA